MRKTLSLDLRQRILDCCDQRAGTQRSIAARFRVSLGMVKKLLAQRQARGEIGAQHHRSGRKGVLLEAHGRQLRQLVASRPDITLSEMQAALGLDCTVQAIHYVLVGMGLTYKKRRSGPVSKTVPTSPRRDGAGGGSKAGLTRRGSSSSMKRRPKQT